MRNATGLVHRDQAPREWRFDALLADGTPVHIRPIEPGDAEALITFHAGLSPDTVYRRFFSAHPRLSDDEVRRFTSVDYEHRFALIATMADTIVAVARFDRVGEGLAEVAFVVADAHQGRGLGSLLLEHLAAAARERGIRRFEADTLVGNTAMLSVFRDAGFAVRSDYRDGVIHLEFPIAETERASSKADERERHAEVASIGRLLCPTTIAVIGASRQRGTIGYELFRNLLRADFHGTVYPVNPAAGSVAGVHAFPTVGDVPVPIDLAVITVPAPAVLDVAEQCGRAGVRSLVVITAGFAETGAEGAALQAEVMHTARKYGMRVVGPNCMGIINTAPGVEMNATFAPGDLTPGRVALLSQSGALGIAVLQQAANIGIGISSFVSAGNKADVSGNDLLQYWETDPSTDVILLYLESFGNPRKFARIAQRVSRTKPIIAVKSGRSTIGALAARSHTASAAVPDRAADALFRQAGVIRVDTMTEMFDAALVLASQPPPAGGAIAIVGNSGGPGIMAADACEAAGMHLANLAPETSAALRAMLPGSASATNPVDLIASATAEQYGAAVDLVLRDPAVDALVVVFTSPLVTRADDVAAAVSQVAARFPTKTVVATFLGTAAMTGTLPEAASAAHRVPVFPFPERAVRALGHAARYGTWLARPEVAVVRPDGINAERARGVVDRVSESGAGRWLSSEESAELIDSYGIPRVTSRVAASADEAVEASEACGFPVVLKAANPDLVHKTEAGGVATGLTSADDVRNAWHVMEQLLGSSMGGGIVQPMVPSGLETIVGIAHDQLFGPLVMFGLGGIATDLLGDVAFRLLPMSPRDTNELISSVRAAPLLFGYRGRPAADIAALRDLILRVAALAEEIPEISELDLNPVMVSETGAVAVDVKIRVEPVAKGPGPLSRRLRATE
jgi:acetyl coenzyme A synthetase (ADP forming)-like protein